LQRIIAKVWAKRPIDELLKVTKALRAGRLGDRENSQVELAGQISESARGGQVREKEIYFSEAMICRQAKINFQQEEKQLLRLRQGFGGQALRVRKKPD
jgi:hypothetical protein